MMLRTTCVRTFHGWAAAALLAAGVTSRDAVAGTQLASRPADDWRKVLDAPERVAGLRADQVVVRLKLKPTDVVADVGAGTGPFVVPFAKAVQKGALYAVEVDSGFLPLIEEKTKAAGLTNVRTVLGVFTDPKLPVSNVDLAFMHDVLHHIEDRAGYLRTLAKYLGPQARIAIIDYEPARSPHRDQPALTVSREAARELLAGAGFKPIEDIALFDDKWFLVFGRQTSPKAMLVRNEPNSARPMEMSAERSEPNQIEDWRSGAASTRARRFEAELR